MDTIATILGWWPWLMTVGAGGAIARAAPRCWRAAVGMAIAEWERQKCRAREIVLEEELTKLRADLTRVGGNVSSVSETTPTTLNPTMISPPSEP